MEFFDKIYTNSTVLYEYGTAIAIAIIILIATYITGILWSTLNPHNDAIRYEALLSPSFLQKRKQR